MIGTVFKDVNAGTHKRTFYRVIRGDDEYIAKHAQLLSNLVLSCNGDSRILPMSDVKVWAWIQIPTMNVNRFLSEEQALGENKSENTATK